MIGGEIHTRALVFGEMIQGTDGGCVIADAGDIMLAIVVTRGETTTTTTVTMEPGAVRGLIWDLLGHYRRAKKLQAMSRNEGR